MSAVSVPFVFLSIDWTNSTFIYVSVRGRVTKGKMSEMVADVEVERGDGLRNRGDVMEVEAIFSSIMGVVMCDWGSSLVRSKTWEEVVLVFFLAPMMAWW